MGSYSESNPRGCGILAAADMVGPGAILKAMPGDVPKTTPIAMVKPFKQKVQKVPNLQRIVAKKKVTAPHDAVHDSEVKPDKKGKLVAGGPGSGPQGGTSGKNNGLDSHPDHSWLRENGWKRTAGDTGKPQWSHARHPGKSFSTGKAADLQEAHFKGKIKAGGPGSGRKPEWLSGKDQHTKLNDLHKKVTDQGFKYKSTSVSNDKTSFGSGSTAKHTYENNKGVKKSVVENAREGHFIA